MEQSGSSTAHFVLIKKERNFENRLIVAVLKTATILLKPAPINNQFAVAGGVILTGPATARTLATSLPIAAILSVPSSKDIIK